MSAAPIGVYDSGVGGLSVLREIERLLPHESVLYVADSANAPWGDKPKDFVRERGLKFGRFLVRQGVKAIVIGSNTGSAGSAEAVRADVSIPVVAMEPGIKPAVAATKSGVVGAMVTATMSGSDRMASLIDRFGRDVKVIDQAVPGLVEHVEQGDLDSAELRAMVEGYVRPLVDAGADTIVLGSTHYVFLRQLIAAVTGPSVQLIDTGEAVARQLARILDERGIGAPPDSTPTERFWTTGDPPSAERVMSALLVRPVSVEPFPE